MKGRAGQPLVVALISGRGSNMRALIEYGRLPPQPFRVALVLSDNPAAAGLRLARDLGVDAHALPKPADIDRASYDRLLIDAIETAAPSLLVLAGFMRLLSAEFTEHFAGRILNIHPSLLPKYPGLHTHRRVLAARDTVHGATVHFVTAELDAGPSVIQATVGVEPGDDEATLAARVLAAEHRIYPLAVQWYCDGRLRCHDGRSWLDGKALDQPLIYDSRAAAQAPGCA